MSGLPATGKDHWVATHRPTLPMIGFDETWKERRSGTGGRARYEDGSVAQETVERAKEHLRSGTDFVFNAVNVNRERRGKLIDLFAAYDARIEVVYLDEREPEIRRRNRARPDSRMVPEDAIDALLMRWEPVLDSEAHEVLYFDRGNPVTIMEPPTNDRTMEPA
jgi:predicted kinase